MTPWQAWICLTNELHFCCGDPEQVYMFVRDLLEGLNKQTRYLRGGSVNPQFTDDNFVENTKLLDFDHPTGWITMYWLDVADLVEHGISCRLSSLTKKGFELLEVMRNNTWENLRNTEEP